MSYTRLLCKNSAYGGQSATLNFDANVGILRGEKGLLTLHGFKAEVGHVEYLLTGAANVDEQVNWITVPRSPCH